GGHLPLGCHARGRERARARAVRHASVLPVRRVAGRVLPSDRAGVRDPVLARRPGGRTGRGSRDGARRMSRATSWMSGLGASVRGWDRVTWIVLAITAVALVTRVVGLGVRALHHDESLHLMYG